DKGISIANNTLNTLYTSSGGTLQPPTYGLFMNGQWQFGLSSLTAPEQALLSMGCPVAGCTGVDYLLQATDAAGFDQIGLDAGNSYFRITAANRSKIYYFSGASLFIPGTLQNSAATATMGLTRKAGSGAGNYSSASTTATA